MLKDVLQAKAAANAAQTAAKLAGVSGADMKTGMQCTASMVAKSHPLSVLPPIVKPMFTAIGQVCFKTARTNMGSALPNGEKFSFKNGYLLTSDKRVIEYIRANSQAFRITEDVEASEDLITADTPKEEKKKEVKQEDKQ